MKYTRYDLGHQHAGAVVEIKLSGNAANVRLVDSTNFGALQQGRQHRYHGGHVTRSPMRLQIPRDDHWYVVVDLGGLPGSVRSSVRMLPGRLAPSPSVLRSIEEIGDNIAQLQGADAEREYDVFISHAYEDKESFVRRLTQALAERDLRVWYDEFELHVGDSLRRKIDAGLANSRFGGSRLVGSLLLQELGAVRTRRAGRPRDDGPADPATHLAQHLEGRDHPPQPLARRQGGAEQRDLNHREIADELHVVIWRAQARIVRGTERGSARQS